MDTAHETPDARALADLAQCLIHDTEISRDTLSRLMATLPGIGGHGADRDLLRGLYDRGLVPRGWLQREPDEARSSPLEAAALAAARLALR